MLFNHYDKSKLINTILNVYRSKLKKRISLKEYFMLLYKVIFEIVRYKYKLKCLVTFS
jgi:hypothetical protein